MELRRPRMELIAAVGVGAALAAYLVLAPASNGMVAVAPRPQPPELAAPSPAAAPVPPAAPSAVAPALSDPASLAELVPGFDGTLVAQLGRWGRMDAAQWPSGRVEPITLQVPTGISLTADVDGRLFAGVGPAALAGPGQALYVGPLAGLRPAAVGVQSAAFHRTTPGRLAWLEVEADAAVLRIGEVDPGGVLTPEETAVAAVAVDQRVVAWGDWGFLLAGWDDAEETWVAYLLDSVGTERWRLPAIDAQGSSRGDVLLAHDAPGGEFRWSVAPARLDAAPKPLDWVPAGALLGAAWSPDGDRIAFVTPGDSGVGSGLEVRRGDGSPLSAAEVPLRVAGVSWSHDGRFVLARAAEPEGRNALFFIDTVDGSLDEVGFDEWVQLAVTRPGQR